MRLTDHYGRLRPEDLEPTGLPELREALASFAGTTPERTALTCGGAMALTAALTAIRIHSSSDVLLCPRPHFPAYPSLAALEGFRTEYYDLDPVTWQPDAAALAAQIAALRPAAVLCNSPHNPTGSVLTGETMARLSAAAEAVGSRVIVDEAFAGLTYDGTAEATPPGHPLVVRVGSFNKRFPMLADARLGYILAEPDFLRDASLIHRTVAIGAGIEAQRAAVEVLRNDPNTVLARVRAELQEHRDESCAALRGSGLFQLHTPDAGLFLWLRLPGAWEPFAFRDAVWARHGFWCAAGPRFGCTTEPRVRLRFGVPLAMLRQQCSELVAFAQGWQPQRGDGTGRAP